MPQAPDHHQVQVQEKVDGNHDVPGHLPTRHLPEMSQCNYHVGHHEDPTEQCGVSTSGTGLQAGELGLRGAGEADPGHGLFSRT